MKIKNKNILIVGGGISGLCIASRLVEKGANVSVYDKGINHSSEIAAGIINPLVFRRMTKSWRVDEFLPELKDFYTTIEKKTDTSFFNPLPIRRLFSSEQEYQFWVDKQTLPEFKTYMTKLTLNDEKFSASKNEFGSGRVKEAYYVNVIPFINAIKESLNVDTCKIINKPFEYSLLDGLLYKGELFDNVIFCEGYENKNNPWFGQLPLDQTKGQTLTIQSNTLPSDESLNRKCFVLPLDDESSFKVGSTYEWHQSDTTITNEARELILSNLSFITDESVRVTGQNAGIRPTTRDRRPLIGEHPHKKGYYIFNGLGAKGYMLAPLLSKEFVSFLEEKSPLDKEVSVLRYFKD